jgi:RNA polymerase sigma-70 factor (ECF subfamily)
MVWTDSDILQKFKVEKTRDQAFTALVHNYSKRLYWHIRRMVNNHEDANDITQDVMLKVFRKLLDFREEAGLYTWMYRIATNEALTFIQKEKRRSLVLSDGSDAVQEATAGAVFDEAETLQKLQAGIDSLPPRQKQVFILRYYDEMKYEEMEKVLDTSVGALKASYHHAVHKLEIFLKTH